MITQETKPVKIWGGFNLVILKVNLNPLSWKNRSSYNKTYKPPRSTSYCYPPVELTDTTMCKLQIHGLLLSWILHQIQAHPLVFSLSFHGSIWNYHQGVENFFSLKTLSVLKGFGFLIYSRYIRETLATFSVTHIAVYVNLLWDQNTT